MPAVRSRRGKAKTKSDGNFVPSSESARSKEKMRKCLLELRYARLYGSENLHAFTHYEWKILYSDGPHNAEYARLYGMRDHALLGAARREDLEIGGRVKAPA